MQNTVSISAETARHVLFHYGRPGGYRPGSFTRKLMETIDAADVVHTARLRTAYPELVDAMNVAANERDGIDRMNAIANGGSADEPQPLMPAADLSKWAADLSADGLTPGVHTIDVGWNDGSLQARLHAAFDKDMPDDEREQLAEDIRDAIAGTVPVR
ncbi:hypothetical protein [Streptomyces sp. NPDC017230]|uniref:hypothetical protein n=1 Tax=unclassified Streptomyces TaxID=2593676 RepID=UPI0037B80BCF